MILHGLFKPGILFPEKTLPVEEIVGLEQSVVQNTLYTAQRLHPVCAIIVQVSQKVFAAALETA